MRAGPEARTASPECERRGPSPGGSAASIPFAHAGEAAWPPPPRPRAPGDAALAPVLHLRHVIRLDRLEDSGRRLLTREQLLHLGCPGLGVDGARRIRDEVHRTVLRCNHVAGGEGL